MNHDRNGNQVNAFGIPTGPVNAEPGQAYHDTGDFKTSADMEVILRDALMRAGVELGTHDERLVTWFVNLADWPTFATVTSWITRAHQADIPETPKETK